MLRQPLLSVYWLPKHPVFWFTSLFWQSQSGQLWLPTPQCAAPVWLRGCHAMPLVTRHFPSTLYCECYGFESAFFTHWHFLLYTPSCCFQGLPGAGSSPWKVAGLHADHQNIALAWLLFWITAINKRGILVGSIYMPRTSFEVRVPQPRNLPLTGFEPAFLKVPCGISHLFWQLGHKVLWILPNK